ncbi:hypothetical protein J3R82DRAFT_154 [Butyriboletus roseoflavus]|nr:hypothetical protein J3R82DRAFT_154 [Butyriboletus roseoflavus]
MGPIILPSDYKAGAAPSFLRSVCCTSIPTTARQRRLLKLGAGTGLLSITAAQILSRTSVQAKIKATDYHPSVLENLARNVQHDHSAVGVSVEKLDWCAVSCTEGVGVHVDVDEDEDRGVGVYHPEHASWIRG